MTTQHPNPNPNPNQVDVTTQLRLLPSPDVMRLVQGRPTTLSAEQLIGEIRLRVRGGEQVAVVVRQR